MGATISGPELPVGQAEPELRLLIARYGSESLVRAGRALYYQGDEAEAAWLVLSGRLRPLRIHGDSSRALEDRRPGAWLGLAETYLGLPRLSDALAVEPSRLLRLSRRNFFELLREPAFKELVLRELALEHYLLHAQLDAAGAAERVARALAGRAGLAGTGGGAGTIRLDLTQEELADSAGLTRETVNRALRRLERLGYLETGRGEILVYDLDGLRNYED